MTCTKKNCNCNGAPNWEVVAPAFENCFFQYLAKNARPHTLQEIADLLTITVSAATTTEKKSVQKLKRYFLRKSITKSGML